MMLTLTTTRLEGEPSKILRYTENIQQQRNFANTIAQCMTHKDYNTKRHPGVQTHTTDIQQHHRDRQRSGRQIRVRCGPHLRLPHVCLVQTGTQGCCTYRRGPLRSSACICHTQRQHSQHSVTKQTKAKHTNSLFVLQMQISVQRTTLTCHWLVHPHIVHML